MHYDDAAAHDEGLFLIMGHVNEGDAEAALQVAQFEAHFRAQFLIQCGERFVKQKERRTVDDRPGEGDALALPSGHLRRETLFNIGGEKATIAFIINGLFLRATINVDISLEEGMIWVR